MANTIRIKRSVSTNSPASLLQGELAYSEAGSPNAVGELFIGTAGPSVTKIITNTGGNPAEPNQSITTGLGISGANGGSSGDITMNLDLTELTAVAPAAGDLFVFSDISDGGGLPKKQAASSIPLSIFNNDAGWEANQTITTGLGLDGADAGSAGNVTIDFAPVELTVAAPLAADHIVFSDASDSGNPKRALVGSFPLSEFDNDIDQITATYTFSNVTTNADPGSGTIRFNNAAPASVTALYVDDLEDQGQDYGWILANLATNDIIVIKSTTDPVDYLIVQVSGALTDNTGYWEIPVTVLFSGSLPTNGDLLNLSVQWFSQGTAGTVTSVTAGVGIANSGTASAPVLDLDFSELTDLAGSSLVGTDELIVQDGGTVESRVAINEISVGLFDNTVTEYVSENDTLVVADWNWVLDEDTMVSNSAVHLATQQSIKAYVDSAVTSSMQYRGGYDANTNTPDLDVSPSGVTTGDTYTVTAAGNFFTEAVQIGDMLIANQDNPTLLSHWTVVQDNIGPASETAPGYIEIATQAEVDAASSTVLAVVPSYLHNTTFDGGTF